MGSCFNDTGKGIGMSEIYLDNSATTKPLEEVTDQMVKVLKDVYGNPSSLHTKGIESEFILKKSRNVIGESLGTHSSNIVFNSGGTEGNNTVIYGVAKDCHRKGKTIITTSVEHPAVLEPCKFLERQGFKVIYLPVCKNGNLSLDDFKSAMSDDVILISIMSVNNEVGSIFPIEKINKFKGNALFHTDAVQAYGKLNFKGFQGDFLTASGHKIHGPKGVGFLYKKDDIRLSPMILGGHQESSIRSGTENMPGIAGMAAAAKISEQRIEKNYKKVELLCEKLKNGILEIGDVIINSPNDGLPYILNVSFMGTRGEVLLHTLEQQGIYVSTGSACSSNKKSQSHVLKAMGKKGKEIESAIRFSLSPQNTLEEIDYVLEAVEMAVKRFRRLGSFR